MADCSEERLPFWTLIDPVCINYMRDAVKAIKFLEKKSK